MLIRQIASRTGCSLISIFYILLFVQFYSCQQSTQLKDSCSKYGQTCTVFPNCPNGNELVQQKRAILCGFQNGNAKICCNTGNPTTYTTSSTTQKTSDLSQKGTFVVTKKPPLSSRNATAVALDYCRQYESHSLVRKWGDPQLPGRQGYWYNVTDCVNHSELVVKGTPAEPKEYPHMALIGYGTNYNDVTWGCGGSLISEKFILSAAHCGKNAPNGAPVWALLGDLDIKSVKDDAKPKVYRIIKVHDHPDYKPPNLYNDISLFELNATVEMGPYVRPACLETSLAALKTDSKAGISGWGRTGTADRTSNKLRKATISIVSHQKCKNTFETATNTRLDHGYDANTMICAGDLVDGKDTCQGDSGGPLQTLIENHSCMWKIVGITSFGPSICGDNENPGVYTKVSHYLSWIQSIVWP